MFGKKQVEDNVVDTTTRTIAYRPQVPWGRKTEKRYFRVLLNEGGSKGPGWIGGDSQCDEVLWNNSGIVFLLDGNFVAYYNYGYVVSIEFGVVEFE